MKTLPSLSELFNLENFDHKLLFEGCENIWDVVAKLKSYLLGLPLGKIEVEIPSGAYLQNPELISIGPGTVVEPGILIRGPCVIGANCQIRHGAYIRGEVLTGNNCVIGHATEAKNSILLDHAHAAHFAYVGDSILGNGVNLGAGTICANLKLNGSPVKIHHEGAVFPTGLRKLGALLGDGSQTGCNAVLNPGTIFGKGSFCYPNVNIGGVFAAGSVIKAV